MGRALSPQGQLVSKPGVPCAARNCGGGTSASGDASAAPPASDVPPWGAASLTCAKGQRPGWGRMPPLRAIAAGDCVCECQISQISRGGSASLSHQARNTISHLKGSFACNSTLITPRNFQLGGETSSAIVNFQLIWEALSMKPKGRRKI